MRVAVLVFLLAACTSDDSPEPPDAAVPDAAAAVCTDAPPVFCEEVVDDLAECPTYEELCTGVCGAAYECCYCGDDGEWSTEFTDCPPCP